MALRWIVGLAALGLALTATAQTLSDEAESEPQGQILGYLAQTEVATPIFRRFDDARLLYEVQPEEFLVVRRTSSDKWLAVYMSDDTWGWAHKERIDVLEHRVMAEQRTDPIDQRLEWVTDYALRFQGTPYVWGGNSLTAGVDCSGFTRELFALIGVSLPRTAAEQAKVGRKVENQAMLRKGDRLFFWSDSRNRIGHTGIYMGHQPDGSMPFVHSSSSGKGVIVSDLRGSYWQRTMVGARRDG